MVKTCYFFRYEGGAKCFDAECISAFGRILPRKTRTWVPGINKQLVIEHPMNAHVLSIHVCTVSCQVVDMRWGVPEQASNNHSTSDLCIHEIRKCQEVSVGPNFVVSSDFLHVHIDNHLFTFLWFVYFLIVYIFPGDHWRPLRIPSNPKHYPWSRVHSSSRRSYMYISRCS